MAWLAHELGCFPIGIWISLAILLVSGGFFTIFAQGLSFLKWDLALKLHLQEDSRSSPDPVEKTMGAISQGEAGADLIVQGALIVTALAGILLRHPVGFVAGITQGVLWIYVTLMVLFQRWMLFRWGMVHDLARLKAVGPPMVLAAGVPGAVMIVCLAANRGWFEW